MNVAIGSADESKVWLDFAKDLGYIDDTNFADWKGDLTDIAKMLTGLYKSWG
ncbi:four helix bundle domain protein [Leptospira inadai serovar Lyme str. 10]|uniref:Four helix bundle domain protein n=1 Tax=Leptospira inadai serovar Lyme str. 10 TaxID=1049790 RepID=V6HIP8_9LEPT|nr:four helix bundle domain protein [Leptospira inadai serovar Lyme str. 10]EQA38187.1 four helix bundle domain protein [Leptospira inadai serovar Lyme str. 10]EQA38321.1 four helix bundle domain protein [Leptospira inadai serovar Lyme str. 10]